MKRQGGELEGGGEDVVWKLLYIYFLIWALLKYAHVPYSTGKGCQPAREEMGFRAQTTVRSSLSVEVTVLCT